MRKKLIFATVFILIIIIFGGSLSVNGIFVFNSRYYSTPTEAIKAESSEADLSVKEEIDIVAVDTYTAIFLALTQENKLLVAEMKKNTKNEFFFVGNYSIYGLDSVGDFSDELGIQYTSFSTYTETGLIKDTMRYAVIFDSKIVESLPETCDVKDYTFVSNYKPFWIVFQTNSQ